MSKKSLESEIIENLCIEVKERRISAWRAASLAKIPLRKMLDELANREIHTSDEAAFEEDMDYLREKYESNS